MIPRRRIVIAGAAYGAGHERVAEALADTFRRHPSGAFRVLQIDLLGRCAPRALRLAGIAWRGGESFFPDGVGTLAGIAAQADDPVVRELVSGGIASAEATLGALEPDIVIATHPVAGGIAAEVSERCGCEVAVVLPDLMPDRVWIHPRVGLWFAAGTDARDRLAARQVAWSRIVVSGVPLEEPADPIGARQLLARAGLRDRFTALVADVDAPDLAVRALRSAGVQVLLQPRAGSRETSAGLGDGPPVVTAPADVPRAILLAASDVVVCAWCGSLAWEAPAAGVPLVTVGEPGAMERASIDLLVNAGAAIPARDESGAADRVAYLASHSDRRLAMAAASSGVGRPQATRAVIERILAGF